MHSFGKLRALAATFAIVPLAVGVEPVDRDTSFTTITFGAGTGSYADVARGCNGEALSVREYPLRDLGVGIEHEMGRAVVGVRASKMGSGRTADTGSRPWTANPHASWEGSSFGIGAGVLVPDPNPRSAFLDEDFVLPVTGHLRTGDRTRGTDFRVSFGESVPMYSPGGEVEVTQGFRLSHTVRGRAGVAGAGPFDQVGLIVRTSVQASDALGIEVRGRLGSSEGVGESTIGFGVTYRIRHD